MDLLREDPSHDDFHDPVLDRPGHQSGSSLGLQSTEPWAKCKRPIRVFLLHGIYIKLDDAVHVSGVAPRGGCHHLGS